MPLPLLFRATNSVVDSDAPRSFTLNFATFFLGNLGKPISGSLGSKAFG